MTERMKATRVYYVDPLNDYSFPHRVAGSSGQIVRINAREFLVPIATGNEVDPGYAPATSSDGRNMLTLGLANNLIAGQTYSNILLNVGGQSQIGGPGEPGRRGAPDAGPFDYTGNTPGNNKFPNNNLVIGKHNTVNTFRNYVIGTDNWIATDKDHDPDAATGRNVVISESTTIKHTPSVGQGGVGLHTVIGSGGITIDVNADDSSARGDRTVVIGSANVTLTANAGHSVRNVKVIGGEDVTITNCEGVTLFGSSNENTTRDTVMQEADWSFVANSPGLLLTGVDVAGFDANRCVAINARNCDITTDGLGVAGVDRSTNACIINNRFATILNSQGGLIIGGDVIGTLDLGSIGNRNVLENSNGSSIIGGTANGRRSIVGSAASTILGGLGVSTIGEGSRGSVTLGGQQTSVGYDAPYSVVTGFNAYARLGNSLHHGFPARTIGDSGQIRVVGGNYGNSATLSAVPGSNERMDMGRYTDDDAFIGAPGKGIAFGHVTFMARDETSDAFAIWEWEGAMLFSETSRQFVYTKIGAGQNFVELYNGAPGTFVNLPFMRNEVVTHGQFVAALDTNGINLQVMAVYDLKYTLKFAVPPNLETPPV